MKNIKGVIATIVGLISLVTASAVLADRDDSRHNTEPYTYLFKFEVSGVNISPYGVPPVFQMEGPGYVPIITSNGKILPDTIPGLKKAYLSNARITFAPSQSTDPGYVARFTCQYQNGTGCHISMPDGSELVAVNDVALEGRLVYGGDFNTGQLTPWGFVPSPAFDPQNGIFPQRILGCGGLKGIRGPLAGTVGSICFNGTFDVPVDFRTKNIDFTKPLVGSSNCTITLHHPVDMMGNPVSAP